MRKLIHITTDGDKQLVSARELHAFLESKKDFSDWIKGKIDAYGFQEDKDFTTFQGKSTGGRPTTEYAITIGMAKELGMVERNEKGKEARLYFIECENKLRESKLLAPNLSHLEILQHSLQVLIDQDKRLKTVESKVDVILLEREEAKEELIAIERSSETPPEEKTRDKIRQLVNAYCKAKSQNPSEVWNHIYDRLYYIYKIGIKRYKKEGKESYLDVAERNGFIDKLYIIASSELK